MCRQTNLRRRRPGLLVLRLRRRRLGDSERELCRLDEGGDGDSPFTSLDMGACFFTNNKRNL